MTLPLPKTEVRIKRRRGGQPGNSNRLSHGGYTRAAAAQRKTVRALLKAARDLTIRAAMVARARRSYRRKREAEWENTRLSRLRGRRQARAMCGNDGRGGRCITPPSTAARSPPP